MGIFLFVGFVALLIVGALTMVGDITVAANSANIWGQIVYYLTLIAGIASFVTGTIACLSLLVRKLADKNMRPYTRRIEYLSILRRCTKC